MQRNGFLVCHGLCYWPQILGFNSKAMRTRRPIIFLSVTFQLLALDLGLAGAMLHYFKLKGVNMKTTVNFSEFRDLFQQIRPDNFSYQGQKILFYYFEEYEESTGEEIEMDIIAICCDFSEDSFGNIADQYGIELDNEMDEDYQKQQVIEHLEGEGAYVGDSINGIVYRVF